MVYEMGNAPELLIPYIESSRTHTTIQSIVTYAAFFLIIANIVACIGILLKKTWSRLMFIISAVVPHTLHIFLDYGVLPPYTAVFDSCILILSGFVIGLLYFTTEGRLSGVAAS